MTKQPLAPKRAKEILEALLFAADQPVSVSRLAQVLGTDFDGKKVRKLLAEINEEYHEHGRAFEMIEIAGGFQILTRPEFKKWVAELHKHQRQDKLSQPAVETLAPLWGEISPRPLHDHSRKPNVVSETSTALPPTLTVARSE